MQPSKPFFEDEFGGSYILLEPGTFTFGDQNGSGHPNEQPCIDVSKMKKNPDWKVMW